MSNNPLITQTVDQGRDWLILLLVGLGISTHEPIILIGGMSMAVSAGMIVWKWKGRRDRRKFMLVIAMAAMAGWAGAILHPLMLVGALKYLSFNITALPIQFTMFVFGFSSNFIFKFMDRVLGRAGDAIIDKVGDGKNE